MSAIHELRQLVDRVQAPHRKEAALFYNKYRFKQFLHEHGIRVPETYFYFTNPKADLKPVRELDSFVAKPNSASSGTDCYVLFKEGPGQYREIDGRIHPWEFIEGKCRQIMGIKRSGGVLIEEVIESSPEATNFVSKALTGIIDYRFYFLQNKPLYIKMRIPTAKSEGYSNTCRGSTALFVNSAGIVSKDDVFKNTGTVYGDKDLEGVRVPYFDKMNKAAVEVACLFKLRFHSVDICPITSNEYVVLESEAIPWIFPFTERAILDLTDRLKAIRTDPA